jgi:hypothetical protein
MITYEVVDEVEAETLMDLQDRLAGLPLAGRNVGPGLGMVIPRTWKRRGKPPKGWTSNRGSIRKNEAGAIICVLTGKDSAEYEDSLAQKLTVPERAKLMAAIRKAAATPKTTATKEVLQ